MSEQTPTPRTDEVEHEFLSGRSLTWLDVADKSFKVFAKMREIERELASARADAERYRYIRESEWEMLRAQWLSERGIYGEGPEQLDAAIDKAKRDE
jgi:hypothetical protein